MTDDPQWQEVGAAIQRRFNELKMSKRELQERSGISDKSLKAYMAGAPIRYPSKQRDLCLALGWTIDSIDRLLRGEPPVVANGSTQQTVEDRLDQVEAALRTQSRRLEALAHHLGIDLTAVPRAD